ncbi:DUF4651 domain-containing protein [Streptococcus caprae]|uniref:DUF4651 domain-containing protein n=1 Tax=Streptococcus caprae TaxID=1640501 RepID=A0ABV8CWF2_9STRE
MKKKKFALVTGILSALGLAAFVGHTKQVHDQEKQEDRLKEVRTFFEPMGAIKVLYVTSYNAKMDVMIGGLVFEDDVTFTFRAKKGQIDYKVEE